MPALRVYLLAIALLWAQLAGALHAVGHVHDHDDDPGHPVCEWCVAFGSLKHGAAATHPPIAGVALPYAPQPGVPESLTQAAAARPYSIRAPPNKPV